MPARGLIAARRSAMTVSVLRPRKSNFTRPTVSVLRVELAGGQVRLLVVIERHQFGGGRSPMTMPAAWVPALR